MIKNTLLTQLETRRSCRAYLPEQIKDEALQTVLEAGVWAPTGMGAQSPVIVVVQDKAAIAQLSKMNAAIMGTDSDPFYGAPTVLVVLADKTRSTHVEDGSLVLGNMMNAAHSIGLGSCWIHRAKEEFESAGGKALLQKWGVPNAENLVGVGHCLLGIPAPGGLGKPKARKADYVTYVR